jgi:hypothetical protein
VDTLHKGENDDDNNNNRLMFLILVKWHERMKTFGAIGNVGQ